MVLKRKEAIFNKIKRLRHFSQSYYILLLNELLDKVDP